MKGRARQKDARFFVFADSTTNEKQLSLENASSVESMVHRFIARREVENIQEFNASGDNFVDCLLECAEETAMCREEYRTSMSSVDLSSSKSLLNRYSLSVPIDPSYRTSKQAISRELWNLYSARRLHDVSLFRLFLFICGCCIGQFICRCITIIF